LISINLVSEQTAQPAFAAKMLHLRKEFGE